MFDDLKIGHTVAVTSTWKRKDASASLTIQHTKVPDTKRYKRIEPYGIKGSKWHFHMEGYFKKLNLAVLSPNSFQRGNISLQICQL